MVADNCRVVDIANKKVTAGLSINPSVTFFIFVAELLNSKCAEFVDRCECRPVVELHGRVIARR